MLRSYVKGLVSEVVYRQAENVTCDRHFVRDPLQVSRQLHARSAKRYWFAMHSSRFDRLTRNLTGGASASGLIRGGNTTAVSLKTFLGMITYE